LLSELCQLPTNSPKPCQHKGHTKRGQMPDAQLLPSVHCALQDGFLVHTMRCSDMHSARRDHYDPPPFRASSSSQQEDQQPWLLPSEKHTTAHSTVSYNNSMRQHASPCLTPKSISLCLAPSLTFAPPLLLLPAAAGFFLGASFECSRVGQCAVCGSAVAAAAAAGAAAAGCRKQRRAKAQARQVSVSLYTPNSSLKCTASTTCIGAQGMQYYG
jgi:hypothetical protein